ncbi:lipopolysaccharide biosynthesis protein [bacterium]|nr:lipopolysaccharide biosynthesis protein [bacterium]
MSEVKQAANSRLQRGLAWSGMASVGTHVLNLLRVMIVARILAPDDFGLFGMAMVVLLSANSMGQLGFKDALIAHEQTSDEERQRWLRSVWTGNLLLHCVLGLSIAALAWPTAQFYERPELLAMLLTLSVVPLLTALRNPELMMREKRIAFGAIAVVEFTISIVGLIFTVALAWWLESAWALVLGQLLAPAGGLLVSYLVIPGRPRLGWDRDALRKSVTFGKYIMAAAILNMIITQMDNLAIGAQLGAAALGIYMIAYRISEIPKLVLTQTACRALYPYYAERLQAGDDALRAAWLQSTRYIIWLIIGAYLPMALCAEFLLLLLFGEQWLAAAPILIVLALLGALRTGNRALLPALMALKQTRMDAGYKLLEAIIFVPAVLVGLAWTGDPIGAAWGGVLALGVGMSFRTRALLHMLRVDGAQTSVLGLRPLAGGLAIVVSATGLLGAGIHPLLALVSMGLVWLASLLVLEPGARTWIQARWLAMGPAKAKR